ncbi:hypothetical protein [Streptomyces bohaiensis]|uniref:Uncharacterized protein n=1 Tax=Streptomyces bohaiensis TaxID=1431344 RepID=A0ABX1CC90_9ACTN|nr:hypothetical protein [Streptomyces bohaiensis]NJQ15012.1 hypothetical protein [Streptomyces bohaiensis]
MRSSRSRSRALRRVGPGDGRPLRRYRWWQPLSRALFHLPLIEDDGRRVTYSVDVPHWQRLTTDDGEGGAQLYRDGRRHATSPLPAVFPVPGGVVEVVPTAFGLRRCHLVADDGSEHGLIPDPRSAEGRRARLARERPGLSRLLAVVSVLLLVVPAALAVPQLLDVLTQLPPVEERLGSYRSPVALSWWLNGLLGVCASVASAERATRLRWHVLLDGAAHS